MKRLYTTLLLFTAIVTLLPAQDTLWVRYDDRFKANWKLRVADADSI
jgi:hypothetical protein